jgi:hypothetical protein
VLLLLDELSLLSVCKVSLLSVPPLSELPLLVVEVVPHAVKPKKATLSIVAPTILKNLLYIVFPLIL